MKDGIFYRWCFMVGAAIVYILFWGIIDFPAIEPIVFLGGALSSTAATPLPLIYK